MTEALSPEAERLIGHYHRLFLAFNRRKLDQIYSRLPESQRRALSLIPVLLHLDLRARTGPLAGIPAEAPAGIVYMAEPPGLAELAVEGLPGVALPRRPPWGLYARDMPIHSLLLVGSLGSVAQTSSSDFDFWVIVDRQKLGQASEEALQAKCRALERWLAQAGRAEATLFLTDINEVRLNRFGELSDESAGSAMATLLKEEFYRSLTLVAGQTPWWWVSPPGLSLAGYRRLIETSRQALRVDANAFVDLGHLESLDPGEFFGASLWNMQKGLDKPFKSVVKLALIEAYAESGGSGLLAEQLKAQVLAGRVDVPDPYLLMFDLVAEHLGAGGREEDLEMVRICLYLKIDPGLTGRDLASRRRLGPDKSRLADYVRQWGWEAERLEELNSYESWPMTRRLELAERINDFMLRTYGRLAEQAKARPNGQNVIDPLDLTALGRRLMLFYGFKRHRVPFLPNLLENPQPLETITFRSIGRAKGSPVLVWEAYEGAADKIGEAAALIRTKGLAPLLAWLAVNDLAVGGTSFYLTPVEGPLASKAALPEVQRLFAFLLKHFGGLRRTSPSREDLVKPARIVKVALVVNLEETGFETELTGLALLHQTSWGELYARDLANVRAGLEEVYNFLAPKPGQPEVEFACHIPRRPNAKPLLQLLRRSLAGLPVELNQNG